MCYDWKQRYILSCILNSHSQVLPRTPPYCLKGDCFQDVQIEEEFEPHEGEVEDTSFQMMPSASSMGQDKSVFYQHLIHPLWPKSTASVLVVSSSICNQNTKVIPLGEEKWLDIPSWEILSHLLKEFVNEKINKNHTNCRKFGLLSRK